MKKECDETDIMMIQSFLAHNENLTETAEELGVNYQHIQALLKKQYIQDELLAQKGNMKNSTRFEIKNSELNTNISMLTPEGVIKEAVRLYNLIPDPDLYKVDIVGYMDKYAKNAAKQDSDSFVARVAEQVVKELKADVKQQLDISNRKNQAFKAIAQYQKDFGETRDRAWEELLLMSNVELLKRAEKNMQDVKESLSAITKL